MASYITLLKREEFTTLFRYGRMFINPIYSIYISDDIEAYKHDANLLLDLFKNRDDFEMVFEYVLINYVTDVEDKNGQLRIENVLGVYALDKQSINSLSVRFDERIVVKEPLWPDGMRAIKMQSIKESCLRGVDNVWRLFDIDDNEKKSCTKIINDEIVSEFVREIYDNDIPKGNKSIWLYLLNYERHEMYPQNDLGYILDTVQVLTNYSLQDPLQQRTTETDAYKILSKYNGKKHYISLIEFIDNSDELSNYRIRANENGFYRVAPLYLKLLQPFRNHVLNMNEPIGGIPLLKQIDNLKSYGQDFYLAAYLLGMILGYEKTYDALYDNMQLKIFNREVEREAAPFQEFFNPKTYTEPTETVSETDYSEPMVEEEPIESIHGEDEGNFMTSEYPKKKATNRDHLTLDTIKNLLFEYPCIIRCGKSEKDKRHIQDYKELVKTLAGRQDCEWKLYTPKKK